MTKKELLRAIRTCKEVSIITHIHEHFCIHVKAVKADLIYCFKFETQDCDINEKYHAQLTDDNVLLIG